MEDKKLDSSKIVGHFEKLKKMVGDCMCSDSCDKVRASKGLEPLSAAEKLCLCKKRMMKAVAALVMMTIPVLVVSFTPVANYAIKQFILNNPEVMIESFQAMEASQKEKDAESANKSAAVVFDKLTRDASQPYLGNKTGDVVIVEFYDYGCGYCKRQATQIAEVLKKRPEVKVIAKDLPILSAASLVAAKASLFVAAKYPSKFADFYFGAMQLKTIDSDSISGLLTKLGINAKEFSPESESYNDEITKNYADATALKVNGTPVFIINGQLHMGYLTADEITSAIDKK